MKISNEQYARSLAESCLENSEAEWPKIINRFYSLLSTNGDSNRLALIIKEFPSVYDNLSGELTAEVKSARKLDKNTLERLTNGLSAKTNLKVTCQTSLDETVIGGAIVNYSDHILDLSLSGGLKQLTKTLAE